MVTDHREIAAIWGWRRLGRYGMTCLTADSTVIVA